MLLRAPRQPLPPSPRPEPSTPHPHPSPRESHTPALGMGPPQPKEVPPTPRGQGPTPAPFSFGPRGKSGSRIKHTLQTKPGYLKKKKKLNREPFLPRSQTSSKRGKQTTACHPAPFSSRPGLCPLAPSQELRLVPSGQNPTISRILTAPIPKTLLQTKPSLRAGKPLTAETLAATPTSAACKSCANNPLP